MTCARDRRQYPRVDALENRVRLEWWEPTTRWSSEGRILNISRSGALIAAASIPSTGGALWLRLDRPVATPWIDGKVVRLDRAGTSGIQFLATADDLFEAATLGLRFGNLLGDHLDDEAYPDPRPSGGSRRRA